MCELFGLSCNRVVGVSFTWRGFVKRGKVHRDGWGVAWYLDGALVGVVKEPRPAPDSPIARLMVRGIRSRIVVSHVRWASRGGISYVNTHPFVRKFWDRDWVFAHNGTVSEIVDDPRYRLRWCRPIGETDSEYAFCYIVEQLSELSNRNIVDIAVKLWSLASDIGMYGKFNFLLSNGEHLFAYMNRSNTLHYILRHPPHRGAVTLLDEDYEVRLEELKAPDEYAAIIATEPLTNEEWMSMIPDTLYVFYNGDLLLTVESGEPKLVLDKLELEVLRAIRTSPHAISIEDIAKNLGLTHSEVARAIQKLRNKNIVKQDSKTRVEPTHPKARYYTNKELRPLIDKTLSL
mgnify:CR=1 FL=1